MKDFQLLFLRVLHPSPMKSPHMGSRNFSCFKFWDRTRNTAYYTVNVLPKYKSPYTTALLTYTCRQNNFCIFNLGLISNKELNKTLQSAMSWPGATPRRQWRPLKELVSHMVVTTLWKEPDKETQLFFTFFCFLSAVV